VALDHGRKREAPGRLNQINYMGHDSLGRYFFYTGFVTEMGITSVTGELERSDTSALHGFYKEVLNNFGY
jgi:hypothetical protein